MITRCVCLSLQAKEAGKTSTYFMNLGKSSGLVCPCPENKSGNNMNRFTHIKTFIVEGSGKQVFQYFELLADEAEAFIKTNDNKPRYVQRHAAPLVCVCPSVARRCIAFTIVVFRACE